MFFTKKIFLFLLLIIVNGCASHDISKIKSINEKSIFIDTPNDRYNILFKEYLERKFNNKKNLETDFVLKANISFSSSNTLSVRGSTVLNSTEGIVKYSILDNNSKLLIKSGSIKTFPALSASSNSLYSNEKSLDYIKERLSQSSANKLYLLTNIILSKLIEN